MDRHELEEIVEKHQLWLNKEPGGELADFTRCNLGNIDLSYCNLAYANFTDSILTQSSLSHAQLIGANFHGAVCGYCNMIHADLSGACLKNANLAGASLPRANLSGACLKNANLAGASLIEANLCGADLTGADINNVTLIGADLSGTIGLPPIACPEKGSFIGFKQAIDMHTGLPVIVELRILEDAKRSSATTRKCRCSKAEVLSITDLDGNDLGNITAISTFAGLDLGEFRPFTYSVGKTVEVNNFYDNRWEECAPGIHFFMNRSDAVTWRATRGCMMTALVWIIINVDECNITELDANRIYDEYYGL